MSNKPWKTLAIAREAIEPQSSPAGRIAEILVFQGQTHHLWAPRKISHFLLRVRIKQVAAKLITSYDRRNLDFSSCPYAPRNFKYSWPKNANALQRISYSEPAGSLKRQSLVNNILLLVRDNLKMLKPCK